MKKYENAKPTVIIRRRYKIKTSTIHRIPPPPIWSLSTLSYGIPFTYELDYPRHLETIRNLDQIRADKKILQNARTCWNFGVKVEEELHKIPKNVIYGKKGDMIVSVIINGDTYDFPLFAMYQSGQIRFIVRGFSTLLEELGIPDLDLVSLNNSLKLKKLGKSVDILGTPTYLYSNQAYGDFLRKYKLVSHTSSRKHFVKMLDAEIAHLGEKIKSIKKELSFTNCQLKFVSDHCIGTCNLED